MSDNITTKLLPYAFFNKSLQNYVAENSKPKEFKSGAMIFTIGQDVERICFLLKGKIKLSTSNGKESLRGPSAVALSQGYDKHIFNAEVVENSLVLEVFLTPKQQDSLLCWEFTSRYFNNEAWINSIKSCEMFDFTPPSNLLKLAQAFQKIDAEEGQIITKENNYEREFYVLTTGEANVYQGDVDENAKALTSIHALQTFGEAALLEDLPRNATIKMSTAGTLMCLDATKLDDLNQENISNSIFISRSDLKEKTSNGEVKLLDIRPEKEAKLSPLTGAVLAPIDLASGIVNKIDSNTNYVIYSPYEELNKLIYLLFKEKNPNIVILK